MEKAQLLNMTLNKIFGGGISAVWKMSSYEKGAPRVLENAEQTKRFIYCNFVFFLYLYVVCFYLSTFRAYSKMILFRRLCIFVVLLIFLDFFFASLTRTSFNEFITPVKPNLSEISRKMTHLPIRIIGLLYLEILSFT